MSQIPENKTLRGVQCPNCGSPKVVFNIKKQGLHCQHCDYTKVLVPQTDQIEEHPLHLDSRLMSRSEDIEIEVKVFHCDNCGSETSFPEDKVRISCPFCGSEKVNETATETRIIKPMGLIPFKITKEEALKQYKGFLTKGWFTPNNLVKYAKIKNLHGVYLPFWTFDAFTYSSWTAQSGDYYYETQYYTDAEGKRQSRRVRKIRWYHTSGKLDHFFDDVTVLASHGVPEDLMNIILPFHPEELTNFDSQYLLGWETELYQKDVKDGFRRGDQIMDARIKSMCANDVPGDTHRFLRVDTHKEGLTFKHMLYPVWVAAYKYKDKSFQFLVNGQTGEIAGRKPKSPWKIALASLFGLLLAGLIAYLFMQGS
ncbi:MAG: zinc ribbon domain-containing protein [Bacteroidota bacterium]